MFVQSLSPNLKLSATLVSDLFAILLQTNQKLKLHYRFMPFSNLQPSLQTHWLNASYPRFAPNQTVLTVGWKQIKFSWLVQLSKIWKVC